ncbi:MAG: efflux RND transporter permease subunit [Alphaproteobacteria bacterium]|nr:efflux RND transporter permease subunit [Alphaproteobacteria bacterium]
MNICSISIKRPITTIVFMIIILLFGYLNLRKIGVREYPNIEIPTISVSTTYTGASASIIETKITQQVENAVAGIEGLDNIQSTSKDGRSNVKLEFSIDRDLDNAANDVRDRVSRIYNKLPDAADLPVIRKFDTGGFPCMMIAVSAPMSSMEITDYLNRYLLDKFSVIEGVASVDIGGNQEKSMRIWLNRKQLAAHNLTVSDVENAIKTENVEYPAGRIESEYLEFPITINRQYTTPEDFMKIIVSRDKEGNPIRISDIAKVVIDTKSSRSYFQANGEPSVAIQVSKSQTADVIQISKDVRNLIKTLQKSLPNGMKMKILRDESEFINESISEVFYSLLIAAILVFFIIFIFIGSIRAAIITAITVPVSIIGSFIVLNSLNYSINMLTLLAMVGAIGIVVDDAILVLENIQRHIEEGEKPFDAAINGSNQVFFAVISTTVVLLSVFLPISMLPGKTGKMFTEFSIAMSTAVCLSSLIALTLTPMLCSKFLKALDTGNNFNQLVDYVVKISGNFYKDLLIHLLSYKTQISVAFAVITAVVAVFFMILPAEYEPKEDRNAMFLRITAQEGTGYYAMRNYVEQILKRIRPILSKDIVKNIMTNVPGFGGGDGAVNSGNIIIEFVNSTEREKSTFQIAAELTKALSGMPGVRAAPILPMGIGASGSHALQFVIGGPDYEELAKWKNIILAELAKYAGVSDIDTDYKETTPKFFVNINKNRAGDLNVSAKTIGSTLEAMLGSKTVTTYIDGGREYDVILQADHSSRSDMQDVSNMYVRSEKGDLVPLDNLIDISESGTPSSLTRHDRTRSITFSGNISEGYSMSDVLNFVETNVKKKLPEYAQIYYRGQSKDYKESDGSMLFIFSLAILISYLALAAQFESFKHPFVVMLSVPLGGFGALIGLYMLGYTMNIYSQIGLIMLIGLNSKHGILIVEFANQLHESGMDIKQALLEAARLRLRPIMMTGISTVAGAIPLLFATGASCMSRQNLGVVEVFGGISGILLTLIIVPVGYAIFNKNNQN